jgi:hypothetical protein
MAIERIFKGPEDLCEKWYSRAKVLLAQHKEIKDNLEIDFLVSNIYTMEDGTKIRVAVYDNEDDKIYIEAFAPPKEEAPRRPVVPVLFPAYYVYNYDISEWGAIIANWDLTPIFFVEDVDDNFTVMPSSVDIRPQITRTLVPVYRSWDTGSPGWENNYEVYCTLWNGQTHDYHPFNDYVNIDDKRYDWTTDEGQLVMSVNQSLRQDGTFTGYCVPDSPCEYGEYPPSWGYYEKMNYNQKTHPYPLAILGYSAKDVDYSKCSITASSSGHSLNYKIPCWRSWKHTTYKEVLNGAVSFEDIRMMQTDDRAEISYYDEYIDFGDGWELISSAIRSRTYNVSLKEGCGPCRGSWSLSITITGNHTWWSGDIFYKWDIPSDEMDRTKDNEVMLYYIAYYDVAASLSDSDTFNDVPCSDWIPDMEPLLRPGFDTTYIQYFLKTGSDGEQASSPQWSLNSVGNHYFDEDDNGVITGGHDYPAKYDDAQWLFLCRLSEQVAIDRFAPGYTRGQVTFVDRL